MISNILTFVVQSLSRVRLFENRRMQQPAFPALHHLLGLAQTRVLWVGEAIQSSCPLSSLSPPAFNLSQHQSLFQESQLFTSGGQSIGASASASVLPMNIQEWFPLLLTGLISLQSKGLSRVFSNTIVQKHPSFGSQLSSWSHSHTYILSHFLLIKLPWINEHNTAHLPVLVSPCLAPDCFVNRSLTHLYLLLPSTVPGTWQALRKPLLSSLTWQCPF